MRGIATTSASHVLRSIWTSRRSRCRASRTSKSQILKTLIVLASAFRLIKIPAVGTAADHHAAHSVMPMRVTSEEEVDASQNALSALTGLAKRRGGKGRAFATPVAVRNAQPAATMGLGTKHLLEHAGPLAAAPPTVPTSVKGLAEKPASTREEKVLGRAWIHVEATPGANVQNHLRCPPRTPVRLAQARVVADASQEPHQGAT